MTIVTYFIQGHIILFKILLQYYIHVWSLKYRLFSKLLSKGEIHNYKYLRLLGLSSQFKNNNYSFKK